MYYTTYHSPFGEIILTANEKGLTSLAFVDGEQCITIDNDHKANHEHFRAVTSQLTEYLPDHSNQ